MNLSLSFLGNEISQLPSPGDCGNQAVEAILLNRRHLEKASWDTTWDNIAKAASLYGNENVTFHFPVDESDYVRDRFVRRRLADAYKRAGELGLAGLVVHSNRIRESDEWRKFDPASERIRVAETLADIRATDELSPTWLGLENMPVVGNFGLETDPLFSSSSDFEDVPSSVGVVWDVCHALSSAEYTAAFRDGLLDEDVFVRPDDSLSFDPSSLSGRIVHWHFAAFRGLNNPGQNAVCTEGLLPAEGDLPLVAYESAMRQIADLTGGACTINFEVQERDYRHRLRGPAIIDWTRQVLASK